MGRLKIEKPLNRIINIRLSKYDLVELKKRYKLSFDKGNLSTSIRRILEENYIREQEEIELRERLISEVL